MFEETISFKSSLNSITLNYNYPNPFNEIFLATDWLSKKIFEIFDVETFYAIILRILSENSFIFISEDIQVLTTCVLGFSYLIQPFKWPFIIIPNLPIELKGMIESPVPYLIGILGDSELKKNLLKKENIYCDLIYVNANKKVEANVNIIIFNLVLPKIRICRASFKKSKRNIN